MKYEKLDIHPALLALIKEEIAGSALNPRQYVELCLCQVFTARTGNIQSLLAGFRAAVELGQWDTPSDMPAPAPVIIAGKSYKTKLTQEQVDSHLKIERMTKKEKADSEYMEERLSTWEECYE